MNTRNIFKHNILRANLPAEREKIMNEIRARQLPLRYCMKCNKELNWSEGEESTCKNCFDKPQQQVSVEPVVKPACEFTDKQLDIISLAVEKWLIEDTFINYNGKHGQHFIDKINGNPTLKDRLLELSKSV